MTKPESTQTINPREMDNPKVTLFGDSITRYSMDPDNGCWASYLAHQLLNYYTVDVRGFSGYTSKWGLQILPKLFTAEYLASCDYFIIFFGHNDSWNPDQYLGVTPSQYKDNLKIMITLLIEDGMKKEQIMVISPGWFDEEAWLKWQKENMGTDTTKTFKHCRAYAEKTIEVARETGVCLVDWFKVTATYQPLEELFSDGLHLSRIGAKLLFDTIWPEIKATLEAKHEKAIDLVSRVESPRELVQWIRTLDLTEEQIRRFSLQ